MVGIKNNGPDHIGNVTIKDQSGLEFEILFIGLDNKFIITNTSTQEER